MPFFLLFLFLFLVPSTESSTSSSSSEVPSASAVQQTHPRVVVTLHEYNACEIAAAVFQYYSATICGSVAKCYGRRLVLNVENCSWAELNNTSTYEPQSALLQAARDWVSDTVHVQGVADVELDRTLSASSSSIQQQQQHQQWNLDMLGLPDTLWDQYGYGESSTVAVLDSGIAELARSLAFGGKRIAEGYDFVSDPELSADGDGRDADFHDPGPSCGDDVSGNWHGTKVASVLAGNYSGFLGVAPRATVLPVRVLGRCAVGYASDVADSIVWAAGGQINGLATVEKEASVIVMAFAGLGPCPSFMQTAVDLALARNATLYAAAGNQPMYYARDHFPANCRGVISVGALTASNEVADYSSMRPDVFMPGGDVARPVPCLGMSAGMLIWEECIGTSMAVPHAAGLAALGDRDQVDRWMMNEALHSQSNATWFSQLLQPDRFLKVRGQVLVPYGASQVVMGTFHACALISKDLSVRCWGTTSTGQVGDSTWGYKPKLTPVKVTGLGSAVGAPVSQICAGDSHTCALVGSDKSVKCWGYNVYGQVGDSSNTDRIVPTSVANLGGAVSQIVCGVYHSCALMTSDGSIKCWGSNDKGQLGDGSFTSKSSASAVVGLTGPVVQLCAGNMHTCAIMSGSNILMCWGRGLSGTLGDGSTSSMTSTPAEASILGGAAVTQVVCGNTHTCVLLATNGTVQCFGSNDYGQLGDGTYILKYKAAVSVIGLQPGSVSHISGGLFHVCAMITNESSIKCWGRNSYGQLSDGTTSDRPVATHVSGLPGSPWKVYAGMHQTCAITQIDWSVMCWGRNDYGQLGDGSTNTTGCSCEPLPVHVLLGSYDVVACPGGTFGAGDGACSACGTGTYSYFTGYAWTCTPCPAGTYSFSNSSSCTACPAGTFSNVTGAGNSTACADCPSGSFSPVNGSTACTLCPAGTASGTGVFVAGA